MKYCITYNTNDFFEIKKIEKNHILAKSFETNNLVKINKKKRIKIITDNDIKNIKNEKDFIKTFYSMIYKQSVFLDFLFKIGFKPIHIERVTFDRFFGFSFPFKKRFQNNRFTNYKISFDLRKIPEILKEKIYLIFMKKYSDDLNVPNFIEYLFEYMLLYPNDLKYLKGYNFQFEYNFQFKNNLEDRTKTELEKFFKLVSKYNIMINNNSLYKEVLKKEKRFRNNDLLSIAKRFKIKSDRIEKLKKLNNI